MRSWAPLFIFFFCVSFLVSSRSSAQPQVIAVRENQELPFASWGDLDVGYTLSPGELRQWENLFPFIRSLIRTPLIQEITSYKIEETVAAAQDLPAPVSLTVYGANRDWVIYAATLRSLPAPVAVARQLKVYLIGLNRDHQLLPNQIIFTIAGERLE